MKIILELNKDNKKIYDEMTLAIGNFDGIHLGHQKMIEELLRHKETKSALMTFSPHPVDFFRKTVEPRLSSKEDKIKTFENMGIDYLFFLEFNEEFSKISKDDFIAILKKYNVKRIVIGKDAHFGYKGEGTYKDLVNHFDVSVLEDYSEEGQKVSSTCIKKLLDDANLDEVKRFLNHPYKIKGLVEHGDKVGRTIGFPTANIDYENYYLPRIGVYYVNVFIDGKTYVGTANIGHNPTLNQTKKRRLEVFIHDFKDDLYDKVIEIAFISYLRPELKFTNKEDLIKQINEDIKNTKLLTKN